MKQALFVEAVECDLPVGQFVATPVQPHQQKYFA
jgi:hypothetical protein